MGKINPIVHYFLIQGKQLYSKSSYVVVTHLALDLFQNAEHEPIGTDKFIVLPIGTKVLYLLIEWLLWFYTGSGEIFGIV